MVFKLRTDISFFLYSVIQDFRFLQPLKFFLQFVARKTEQSSKLQVKRKNKLLKRDYQWINFTSYFAHPHEQQAKPLFSSLYMWARHPLVAFQPLQNHFHTNINEHIAKCYIIHSNSTYISSTCEHDFYEKMQEAVRHLKVHPLLRSPFLPQHITAHSLWWAQLIGMNKGENVTSRDKTGLLTKYAIHSST